MKSLWIATTTKPNEFPQLTQDIRTEVLVIGGGLAGVLCAYELSQRGVHCILVEKHRIGNGNTANTTAKITAQHGAVYDSLLQRFGVEKARMYFDIHTTAIAKYRHMAADIACDFEDKTAYIYSTSDQETLSKEATAYERIGIPYTATQLPPIPFQTAGALGIVNQAQFHPLKFLYSLLPSIEYYEHTFVERIENNQAFTANAVITAKHIILATHYPLVNIPGKYFLKLTQHRSYVVALENTVSTEHLLDLHGMYIDVANEGYSFRNYRNLLLIGGGGHKTGKGNGGWQPLHDLAVSRFPNSNQRYHWAAEDCMTLDQIPYIGIHRKQASHLYAATGFNKWGMTGSMAAAMVLSDMITRGTSDYAELFTPSRSMFRVKLAENIASAGVGLLTPGKRCSHMGCGLKWNQEECTYDCPCHGSRFDKNGAVLDGPAKKEIAIHE